MKRTGIGPGAKSLARNTTFGAERKPLARRANAPQLGVRQARPTFTPASPAQRAKVASVPCRACPSFGCDPAHVTPRAKGGCDHADCVVGLCRQCHRAYDDGLLELLPHLTLTEQAHAVAHMGMVGAMRQTTKRRT